TSTAATATARSRHTWRRRTSSSAATGAGSWSITTARPSSARWRPRNRCTEGRAASLGVRPGDHGERGERAGERERRAQRRPTRCGARDARRELVAAGGRSEQPSGSAAAAALPRIVRRSHYDHPDTLLKVVSTRGVVAAVVRLAPGLELVDHPVEVLAGLLAELLPHLAHPARHALGIVLVEPGEGGVVGERIEAALLGAPEGEARHQAGERAAPAVLAHRLDRLAHAQREDGHLPLAG